MLIKILLFTEYCHFHILYTELILVVTFGIPDSTLILKQAKCSCNINKNVNTTATLASASMLLHSKTCTHTHTHAFRERTNAKHKYVCCLKNKLQFCLSVLFEWMDEMKRYCTHKKNNTIIHYQSASTFLLMGYGVAWLSDWGHSNCNS